MIRNALLHLALNVPYVPFRPYVLGLAIGRMPHRVDDAMVKKVLEKGK